MLRELTRIREGISKTMKDMKTRNMGARYVVIPDLKNFS